MTGGKSPAMMPCPGCGVPMAIAADKCAACGRDNEIVKAYMGLADNVAREQGYSSMDDAARTMAVMGPMLAGQVKRGALGLAAFLTGVLMLFAQQAPTGPSPALTYVLVVAAMLAILYVTLWWLLGGRNTHNPFALVKPAQLGLRRLGGGLLWPGLALLVVEVGYFIATDTRLCFCER